MSKLQTSLFMIIPICVEIRISHHPVNQGETTPHQMSSACFKEEWKRMVTSAAQAQRMQDALGIHLPPDSNATISWKEKGTTLALWAPVPKSYHSAKVMQLRMGSALTYTPQYSPGVGVQSSALKHMHMYIREKNLIQTRHFCACSQESAYWEWMITYFYISKVEGVFFGFVLFFFIFKTFMYNLSQLLLTKIIFGIRISLQNVNSIDNFLPEEL